MNTFPVYRADVGTTKGERNSTPVFEESLWKLEYKLLLYLCINVEERCKPMDKEQVHVGSNGAKRKEAAEL